MLCGRSGDAALLAAISCAENHQVQERRNKRDGKLWRVKGPMPQSLSWGQLRTALSAVRGASFHGTSGFGLVLRSPGQWMLLQRSQQETPQDDRLGTENRFTRVYEILKLFSPSPLSPSCCVALSRPLLTSAIYPRRSSWRDHSTEFPSIRSVKNIVRIVRYTVQYRRSSWSNMKLLMSLCLLLFWPYRASVRGGTTIISIFRVHTVLVLYKYLCSKW
ncbi:hypothetical protein RvY_18784-2 [Ramazzottius varieornatus]|uniref:Uncharacterized protein n=1 Tax=Ramazzottius varieornatus TaxID=947166 RepID=A0A1D1W9Z0_RAMVA|nr:hypothetical protein RvY_18784-2 [Ramazzottius varieornatus]